MRNAGSGKDEETRKTVVLIVDDNENNLQITAQVVHNAGYQVLLASDGVHALTLASEEHPDVILLDIMMPGMDGLEVCRRLQSDRSLASIPVIFLSAKDEDESIETGLDIGGSDYIIKPFSEKVLLARLRSHIDRSRYQRELVDLNKTLALKNSELLAIKEDLVMINTRLDEQIQHNIMMLAAINDQVRNPLTIAVAMIEMSEPDNGPAIIEALRRIDAVIDDIDKGFIESDKIREYLRKHHHHDTP